LTKDSLIKGTVILAAAAMVARVLGVVQRVPLQYLIGDAGNATYTVAFNIYMLLLTVATAGIPSALSKLVSERVELGRLNEANRIFAAAVRFALVAGVLMTVVLYFYAPIQAKASQNADAVLAIRALAPALLLFPLIAMMRGYFQGRQNMMPNGLSQIIEQIARLIFSIGLAWMLIGWGRKWAVAGASFGSVMGSVGAVAVLIYYWMKLKREDSTYDKTMERSVAPKSEMPYRTIYATIFKVAVPVVLFSMTVPLIYAIDSTILVGLIKGLVGFDEATIEFGILGGRAQPLAGIPIILAIALSQSIVPIISSAYAKKDVRQVAAQAKKALQLSVITGLPACLVIAVAARPINGLLFSDTRGSGIIAFLTLTAFFQILMQTSGAILMGLGKMKPLVLNMIIGIAIKLAGSYILGPWLGIYGVLTATALCFFVMMVLNFRMLRKSVPFEVFEKRRWTRLFVISGVIYAFCGFLERWGHVNITGMQVKIDAFINTVIVCSAAGLLYLLLIVLMRVVTRSDLDGYPSSVRKLLGRIAGLLGR
jgi:stage V sporulation protein B